MNEIPQKAYFVYCLSCRAKPPDQRAVVLLGSGSSMEVARRVGNSHYESFHRHFPVVRDFGSYKFDQIVIREYTLNPSFEEVQFNNRETREVKQ